MTNSVGAVLGVPGASLAKSGSWADPGRAAVGLRGERATAAVTDPLTRALGGPSVIHDLRIPLPGVKANIDHLVVSGRTVTIIDSKMWAPGFYWTVFGRSFRGLTRFPAADKQTLNMAVKGITDHLSGRGIRASVARPLLIVWPSSRREPLQLWALRSPGARAVTGEAFTARARSLAGGRTADPAVFAALGELVYPTGRR